VDELESFCDSLYGEHEGHVYSPIKDTKKDATEDGYWKQYFFKWPTNKRSLFQHVRQHSKTHEVYIAPPLYDSPKVSYDTFLGTNYVWAEFDGSLPETLGDIPEPTIKIQSSTKNHEHWYWRLDEFATDAALVSLISKKIAYALRADLSGWDATQVLRPPTTIHHESKKIVSRTFSSDTSYPIQTFSTIAEPPLQTVEDIKVKDLPDIDWLIALHKWEPDTFDLFKKPGVPVGSRSSALFRLAFDCIEMGMSNKAVVTILYDADNRWKKYSKRPDQVKRLLSIVQRVRSKKGTDEVQNIQTPVLYRFQEFMDTKIELDWIIEGILPVAGQTVIFGPSYSGKTTLVTRMGLSVASGIDSYLDWKIIKQKRVAFISAEMAHEEVKQYFKDMNIKDTHLINETFMIYPLGHAFPLNRKDNKRTLLEMIDQNNIEVLILDSLSVIAGGSTNDDQTIIELNEFINTEVRKKRRVAVIHIHHSRKPGIESNGNKKWLDLPDLYGSVYIGANAITVIGMLKSKGVTYLNYAKGRYTLRQHEKLIMTETRDFRIPEKGEVKDSDGGEKDPGLITEMQRFGVLGG